MIDRRLWRADLFVMASEDEGAPLALLEAMASGLAWVSTGWGAAAQLPVGECGLVVPARSPHRLAAAIAELINDPERRQAMGHRGRQRAVADFGEDRFVGSHHRILQELKACPEPPFAAHREELIDGKTADGTITDGFRLLLHPFPSVGSALRTVRG